MTFAEKRYQSINSCRLFIVSLILTVFSINTNAQLSAIHDFRRIDSVIVVENNLNTLEYPFAGGLNNCQFANIDINLDGTDDLLVFDRHGNRILPFITSTLSPGMLRFAPEFASEFPPIEQWVQAVDYNMDGKKDLFTYTVGGIKVYRNDSGNSLKFTEVTNPFLLSLQGITLTNILVTYADYPVIADVDNDEDMDVLTFWGLGSFVEWHKNTSMERFGNADSLTFEKVSSCWGHFAEGNESNVIKLDTCAAGDKNNSGDPKHTGSTLLLNDLNGDGLPDITIGDVDFSSLIQLINGGTMAEARIVSQTTNFPNAQHPVNLNTFPAAMLVDVNNDCKKDLLVSPFDPSMNKGENFKSVTMFQNIGTNAHPEYNFISDSYLQDQMLDFGSGAYPVFFDYNGDGQEDILVGNYGYSDTCIYSPANGLQCTYRAKVALLQNVGTAEKPAFRLADRNIAHFDTLMMQSLIPALADIDGDGDLDLICGNSKGRLIYCENIALQGHPTDFIVKDTNWFSIDVGDYAAPAMLDIDNDGLTDLICGKRNGTLSYYKNTGNVHEADFMLISDHFGEVDVTNTQLSNYGYSTPCFYKDKQGQNVLFTGSEFGDIFVYDQINNNLTGSFRQLGTIPTIKEGWRSSVAIGNLNNDTITDMLVGNYSGGLELYYGKPDKIFGINNQIHKLLSSLLITPNPANSKVSINLKPDFQVKNTTLIINNIEGQQLKKYSIIDFPTSIDVSDFNNGIYLITVQTPIGFATGKMVICR